MTGHDVTIFDSLVTGHRAAVPDEARFIEGDLGDQFALVNALEGESYEAVMHFAGFIEAGESMKNPGKYFKNNFAKSVNLIEATVNAGIQRFVLSSTAAVYATNDEPLSEESALDPANVYGQTKLMIEQSLSHLIPLVLQVPLGKRAEVKIFGTDYPTPDGTCIRDYIHVADLTSAHLLALERLEQAERLIYNLGNGTGYSVREVIDTAREVTGHSIKAVESARRPGDAPRLVASSEKIQRELGWVPQAPDLDQIINSAWEWHQSNPEGYG
jgi:UDP-glucose 4-epimerase